MKLLGKGMGAVPGTATGTVHTTSAAMVRAGGGILVRPSTDPNDIDGMEVADGILTAEGGRMSHAAVVARGWGKPCVVGFGDRLQVKASGAFFDGKRVETLMIDGGSGEVWSGD